MRKPVDTSRGPKGGLWIWKCPETGFKITHTNYNGIRNAVLSYKQVNHFPITSQFNDELDENLCQNADPVVCYDFTPPSVIEKMGMLGKALAKWANGGMKVRSEEEVLNITQNICPSCEYYGGETGFLKLLCRKCGCSKLKAWLKTSHCPLNPPRW